MARRHVKLLALALLVVALFPPQGDAIVPEPVPDASRAACCNVADAPPPPVSSGDLDFFSIASGVPNVMILLDNSGSMKDLPRSTATFPIEFPEALPAEGTCSLPSTSPLERLSAARTTTPYDAGYRTWFRPGEVALEDAPPWTTACTTTARPQGDRLWDGCLFRPTSFFKYVLAEDRGGAPFQAPVGFGVDAAMVFNAAPSLDGDGHPTTNAGPCVAVEGTGGRIAGSADELRAYYDACRSCLDTKGYFLFDPPSGPRQAVVRGDLLNVYPDNPLIPKAHTARKLIKDVVRLDPQRSSAADAVRFGLTVTTGGDGTCSGRDADAQSASMRPFDGGRLLVPLGPDCEASARIDVREYAAARQRIVDAINDARGSASTCTGFVDFGSWTPPGEALFNVGQYFARAGGASEYRSRFGEGWMKLSSSDASQDFSETSAGAVGAAWAGAGHDQRSFCFRCQLSSVLLISDGMPTTDGNVPASPTPAAEHSDFGDDFRSWVRPEFTEGCPSCAGEVLHKVAAFLGSADLRTEAEMEGTQAVRTFAVSFGLDPTTNGAAIDLLDKTAELGGTTRAFITNSDTELKAALDTVVASVERRLTSFSSTNATSLQTSRSTSADAYLGRFRPANGPTWEGHLYAAQLFDEFGEGCSEAFTTEAQQTFACGRHARRNPNLDGDALANGNARCQSSYLVDRDCDPIVEDDAGFRKGDFNEVTHALASNGTPANLPWDAGAALSDPTDPVVVANASYRSAAHADDDPRKRWIWTVIDRDADGLLTAADGLVELRPENAAALAPMMDLAAGGQPSATALPTPTPWCNAWLDRIGVCGRAPLPSCGATAAAVQTRCAEQLILFYRGWDVTDQDGDRCAGPGNPSNTGPWGSCTSDAACRRNREQNATCVTVDGVGRCRNRADFCPDGEQRDRSQDSRETAGERDMWKLGDIFHSSPVLVRPPVSKEYCRTGAFNQCVLTLYSALGGNATATTPLERYDTLDAYDAWRAEHLDRRQFVVVGANDGMLHAFDAGTAREGTATPIEGYRYTSGTGAELWAFVPPDLLPRLRRGVEVHTTFVDGNPMVRDVWVDGSGGHLKDGRKQRGEFHTVAIVTERGGGQRFTALDVTDPLRPAFLWTFPQPCSKESKLVAQTWADFLPRPPPIGPVRLAVAPDSGQDPLRRGFEERWVAFLNGGYDPALVRGRGVFMVDAWTGEVVWSHTDADFKRMRGDDAASMFPIAAAIAMVDIGAANARSDARPDTDGYFDTATFGDLGGNLYTARFHEPGRRDDTGRVTNWTLARAFEQNRQADDGQRAAGRGAFFHMTENVLDGPARLLSLAGSGDRENLLLRANSCGPTNVLGCCASGCPSGTSTTATRYGASSCTQGGTFTCADGVMTFSSAAASTACDAAGGFACGAVAAPDVNQQGELSFTCGGAGDLTGSSRFAFDASGLVSLDAPVPPTATLDTSALGAAVPQYRMFAVWAYGEVASRKFADEESARAFDGNRLTDVAYAGCADMPDTSCRLVETAAAWTHTTASGLETTCRDGAERCWAEASDPGWMYSYGTVCPMESCSPSTWNDERSATGVNVALRCADWSTLRPDAGRAGVPSANPCSSTRSSPAELSYLMDAVRGAPRASCGVEDVTPSLAYYAGRQRSTLAPPQSGATRIVVNARGEVSYSTLRIESGAPPEKTGFGTRSSVSELLYWLEVSRAMHVCRHADPTTCR